MNIIELSIRRPVFAWVLMFSLIVFGAIALNRTGVSQMPDVDFPILTISMSYEGAAPEVVEADLLDPLESQLLTIEGIKEMRSSASQGSGRITLEFDIDRNIDVALQEVQTAISQYRLPVGMDPPIIRKTNPEEDPILIVSFYTKKDVKELAKWVENYLLDQIRFLEGVGEVDIGGFSQRNLRIWFDLKKLRENELTVTDVVQTLNQQHLESAAGQFTEGPRELRVRWLGEATDPEAVGNILILRRGGEIIHGGRLRIKDVAVVEDGLSDIRQMTRYKDQNTIALRIKKQRGTNEVKISELIQNRLKLLKSDFPEGYDYRVNVDFTASTKATVDLTVEKLWMAALITILVCFLFLGNFQSAINILFSIPTSIMGTFIIVHFSGFTLNLFTLLALTLSISIVVDDAIMLLENIIRHHRMGKSAKQAAADGAKEVLPAAIAASLAVVAIFIPVIFMDGVVGKYFYQFGVTMSAAVLLSLLEAVTITPMRASTLMSNKSHMNSFEKKLDAIFKNVSDAYQNILSKTLQKNIFVVGGSILLFVVSLLLVFKVRQELVPAQDQNLIMVMGQTPPGSSLEITNIAATQIEKVLNQIPEVESFVTSVGSRGSGGAVNQLFMPVRLVPKNKRDKSHTEVMGEMRKGFAAIKGARINMRDLSARNLTSGRMNPLAVSIRGPDINLMDTKSKELIEKLEQAGLGVDLDTDYRKGIPELIIEPDRTRLAENGISIESVGDILRAAIGGLRQGRYTADGRRYDIRFKTRDESIRSAADIESLYIRNSRGNLVPIKNFIKIREAQASQSIQRVNRERAISVFGNIAPGKSQADVLIQTLKMGREILPENYKIVAEGASAGFNEAFDSLFSALMIGILVAYLILAVQFNSFVHPVSILMALPFSISGALIALWMFNQSLNLFSFIGLIVLMGIAKKNSIMLVEFTNHIREHEKLNVMDALLKACPIRLRPIIMTSVATVVAAVPLILGSGMGSETRLPMGLTIIGGTIVSTILTLFVVPSIYKLLSHLESGTYAK
jgi:hydrophobe/amphiphile efflux-1 (HAE1) family protein